MKNIFYLFVYSTCAFIGFLIIPQISMAQTGGGGGCAIAINNSDQPIGRFRTYSSDINILQDWFASSVALLNAQPYIYLDVQLSQGCEGESVTFKIQEHDSLDPNDEVVSYTLNNVQQLQQTLVFRAGDTWCDGGDGGDCDYFLLFQSQDGSASFSPGLGGVGTQASLLNIEYDCYTVCDNQNWEFLIAVNSGNFPSYQYGTFISDTDPHLVQGSGLSDDGEDGGLSDDGEDGGLSDDGEDDFAMTAQDLDCGNADGVGCIQNPLGPGSNLGNFLESLIAIIVQAGIPLIVLALVYSGFRFVLARGNPEKLVEARQILLWTVVGTAILLGAWTIASLVSNTMNAII